MTPRTVRLYYDDPDEVAFDATVLRVRPDASRYAVWLDRSAFYPTTGGQPFDTGTLAGGRIVDVVEDDDGDVKHVLEGGVALSSGQQVHGVVDWPRRFDHMQQHTGQHVLSAAFVRLFGVKTVSFHLGAEASTIDLAQELMPREIEQAENEANRVVWEDRPVAIRYASAEDAAAMPLRKPSARAGRLRLIEVEGFDLSACGGTHVKRTGAIGVIAISSWERFKGGLRLEFTCGGRALGRLRALRDVVAASDRLLSVSAGELPSAIQRLQEEVREQKRILAGLQTELAGRRAVALAAGAEASPIGRVVLQAVDADATGLKGLAAAIAAQPGHLAVLVSTASPALVVAARSGDVGVSCHDLVTTLAKTFGGRGGGKPDFAQGGGLEAPAEVVLAAASKLIALRRE